MRDVNRRFVLGAGLALSVTTTSAVQAAADAIQTGYANGPGVLADQYFFPAFRQSFVNTSGATINTLIGGKGPPILLIHGHPETHVAWHEIAAKLAERFTVVMTDLRGYGDSSKPDGGPDHVNYSKRAMGLDQVEVMKSLGFESFQAIGHDRGGRVLHRMMLDHPGAITRGVVLDIAPTDQMYGHTNQEFATKYFWWFFHIQDAPLPETMINAVPEVYLKAHLEEQSKTADAVTLEAFAEYLRCYRDPACVHAVCEDYRASVSIDMKDMQADPGRKVSQPLLALWGAKGTVGKLFDVISLWKLEAENVNGEGLPCGHLIPEEAPEALLAALDPFLVAG
jgi:haloacetate dehalogenase